MSKQPNWEQIRREWETTKITFKDLAEKHGIKLGTLKSRRSREQWSRDPNAKKDATSQKDATRSKKKMQPNKKRAKQRNRSGNPNPQNQFTERNSAALKHGFFSRYIPKETLEIMQGMASDNPADLMWDQIMIQYAAIIRAQQIMFVEDKGETVKELKKLKIEDGFDQEGNAVQIPVEKEYEVQFAWDRHAVFMNAQSRAISELRTSIKQFVEMTDQDDVRRLQLEVMQAGIDKTYAEIERIEGDKNNQGADDWVTALKQVAEKRERGGSE